jgi:hypothetical protein
MTLGGTRIPRVPPAVIAPADIGDVVAGLGHDGYRHDAHEHDGGSHRAGGDAKDGGGDEHAHVEGPGHRPHQELESLEQALHEAALLHQIAHEDE